MSGFSRGRRTLVECGWVLAGLLVLSIAIRASGIDLVVERLFYRAAATPRWWGVDRQPWEAFYRYGSYPAIGVGALALVALLASSFVRKLRRHMRACLLLVGVLAIGPGLLVNTVGKDHWGRPRPRDVVEFGGGQPYVAVGCPVARGGHSFPSGHAAVGFYWLTLYVLWRGRRPRAARAGLALGLVAGLAMGFERMAVGAHYPSDVLWAGGIDYLVALGVDDALARLLPGNHD
jgi:membrane-associated PAP2 superfamily phosphatase